MTICLFGYYNPDYTRNKIIIQGLIQHGIQLVECNIFDNNLKWGYYINLYKKYKKNNKKYNFDYILIPHSKLFFLALFAKFITRKPIIWDSFFSKYHKWVFDTKKCKKYSFKALFYFFSDWVNCFVSDKIILDTNEHINYYVNTFKINKKKFIKVLVGADEKNICTRNFKKKAPDIFLIHFHGNFSPLQGIEYIVKAAKILEPHKDIVFNIVGDGYEYNKIISLSKELNIININFISRVPYNKLGEYICAADVCLGVFGNTQKTQMIIPTKVYEAIACRKAVISADTPAMRELFNDKKNILFCRHADPKNLADKILELKNNLGLRNKIANNGYRLYKKKCVPKIIIRSLINSLI